MRLLERQKDGSLSLTKDLLVNIPEYAILSHTWGEDDEEITFKDLTEGTYEGKAGYEKLQFCGNQAANDGLQYFWVDTCCIDKSNSTELIEAVNSMFQWYRNATKCYVFLSDVSIDKSGEAWERDFRISRWFTRGWTLQELIAPRTVEFFSIEGKRLGDKQSLEKQIHEITEISIQALRRSPLSHFPTNERMRWAANRNTTRKEDKAYCLLGIFGIYIPLIYGEGDNAITRLQKEISQTSKVGVFLSEQDRQQHYRMTDWLSTLDFPAQQSDFIARRETGTGQWFLDTPEFKKWIHTPRGTLFCPGIPGAGKTMMVVLAIDHLMKIGSNIGLAYIFCNYQAQEEQNIIGLLAAILKQLTQEQPSISEPLIRLYERHFSRRTRPSLEDIFATLHTVTKSLSTTYIVIDGLDECSDRLGTRGQLLRMLRELQRETDLRLLITSRFIQDIENEFESTPKLEVRASDADVKQFVHSQIHRLPSCVQYDQDLQAFVKDKIVEAVDGMLVVSVLTTLICTKLIDLLGSSLLVFEWSLSSTRIPKRRSS
jgi:hypothetical protein